jgi:hypothetical protein
MDFGGLLVISFIMFVVGKTIYDHASIERMKTEMWENEQKAYEERKAEEARKAAEDAEMKKRIKEAQEKQAEELAQLHTLDGMMSYYPHLVDDEKKDNYTDFFDLGIEGYGYLINVTFVSKFDIDVVNEAIENGDVEFFLNEADIAMEEFDELDIELNDIIEQGPSFPVYLWYKSVDVFTKNHHRTFELNETIAEEGEINIGNTILKHMKELPEEYEYAVVETVQSKKFYNSEALLLEKEQSEISTIKAKHDSIVVNGYTIKLDGFYYEHDDWWNNRDLQVYSKKELKNLKL